MRRWGVAGGTVLTIIAVLLLALLTGPSATQASPGTSTTWSVDWYTVDPSTHLLTGYLASEVWAQPTFSYNWGNGVVYGGLSDHVGFRATATIKAASARTVTFSGVHDDGLKFYVDGSLVYSKWEYGDHSWSQSVSLTEGKHTLMLEYYEDVYAARVSFTADDTSIFTWNDSPVLSNGYVTPSSGTPPTTYYYYVTFQDNEGETPQYVRVNIDGTSHDMTYQSGSYTSGATYRYTASSLSAGFHTYYSEALDGEGATGRYPSSGSLLGPTVNTPPVLENGRVSPSSGEIDAYFTYQVTYRDADGNAPSYVKVWIDNGYVGYSLSYVSGAYTSGAIYRGTIPPPECRITYVLLFCERWHRQH
jgi:hypothetical protein